MLNPIRNVEKAPGPGGPAESGKLGYDPRRHRPHNYPVKRLVTGLGAVKVPKVAKIGYEGGGDVEDSTDEPLPEPMDLRESDDNLSPRDQQMKVVVTEAMAALCGEHPDPQKAIQKFISVFGEQDFKELRQMMLGQHAEPDEDDMGGLPDSDQGGMQVGGLLRGPGSGQDDQIEATTPTGRKVLLSDGEYVIDAPTVAALGDGSTDAGARRLDKFRQSVRKQAYGHEEQAKPMRKGGRAALLNALNS